ncbi:unnamed protein product [Prunus armeniaca]|uniref:Uncharacterized protein n=1 Tax=Prunus armeniaca TaxID=36596 RepID=A0A6J5X6A4_PRUAR|nr:unnamed protein product [Prunus armeniaca]
MNQARGVGGYGWVCVVFWVHRWEVQGVDDFSRRVWVNSMKPRDEALKIFPMWKKMIETQSG